MGEKKPSIGTWELEEEAREKGESSEKLTKIKKKEKKKYIVDTQHTMGSRESSRTRHRLTIKKKKKNKRVH